MPNLKETLKEFVATANAGGYDTDTELLSAFPELSGYDINMLKEFVATANAGQYANEDELLSAFPEFEQPVKKKEETSVPLWLQKQEQPKPKQEPALPFLESKPSGISLGSQRVPETAPMFEPPPMRTPEEAQAIVEAPEKVPTPAKPFTGSEETFRMRTKEEAQAEGKPQLQEQTFLNNVVSAIDKSVYKNLIGEPIRGIGTALKSGSPIYASTGDALIRFGDWYNKAIDELTPQDEEFKGTLTDQFAQAFGQVAAIILTEGVAGTGAKTASLAANVAPKTIGGAVAATSKQLASDLIRPGAISAGLTMGQSEFDRAKQAGATDEQAFEAFYKNAAVGSVLEQIPVMQFLKRFNQSTAGGVANYIKTKGVAGLTGGFEEMTTEVLQQLYANKTAQEIYNINQDLLEGVGESGGIGFGVGFLLNAMGAKAKALKKEGNVQEAQIIENQIDQFESKPQGPPPTYSVNGIKMQSPEVINQMIDNMNAAELSTANIEITNDPELNNKLQEKIVVSSTKQQVRDVNPNLDEETLDKITLLETELKKLEGNKTQTAKDKAADIRSQIKTLQENAVQKPSTEEGVLRPEEPQVGLPEVGEGNAQEQAVAEETVKETESKIKRRDLFDGVGAFSRELGGSDVDAVPVSHSENNGIEFVQYANPKTGSVDVIVTGTSENDFVGFYRIYENGKPTNKWSSKFENQSRNKENFKTMISGVQEMLPEGHEYTEKTSISTDGLRVWNQQLDKGYEIQYDQNGNPVTNEVAINGDAIVNELGIDVNPGAFDNIRVTTNEQFNKVKNALLPYLNKMGLNESNIKWEDGTVKIDLPVLRKSSAVAQEEVITPDAEVQAAFDRLEMPEEMGQEYDTSDPNHENNMEVLAKIIDKNNIVPEAEPRITIADNEAVVEYLNQETGNPQTTIKLKRKKNGGWTSVGAVVEKEAVSPTTPAVKTTPAIEVRDEQGNLVEEIRPQPIEIFDEDGNLISTTAAATPQIKTTPVPVVSQPVTRALTPESLQEEYINKINDVRLNEDKSRTPKQVDQRIAELKAEYQKLKAEMTAPKPKAKVAPKVEAKPKPEAKPAPAKVVSKKDQEEIKALEDEIEYQDRQIEDAIEEIGNTKYNLKEALAEIKKKRDELKGKKMSKEEREDAKEDLDAEIEDAKDEHDTYLEQYNDQLSEAKKAKKQAEAKLAKLQAKQAEPVSVVEEEEPSYEEAKDLDLTNETNLQKVLRKLDGWDSDLTEFGRGSLSMGMTIPVAKAIIKSLKVLVKTGITLQEAIKRVAVERNMEEKEIVNAIMELDKRQRPMTKLRDQIKAEIQSAKAAKKDLNQKRKDLSNAIKEMEVSGKISSVKSNAILNKIGKLNLDSNVAVEKFLDYVEKIFADAEYANKLNIAKETRSQIRKLSKSKDKFANLRDLGSKFVGIDPSMVDDIDKYNEIASLIKESIKGSTTRKADVKLANMIEESDAMAYINKAIEAQQKMLLSQKADEVQELLDIDASDLTYDQLVELVDSDKTLTKYNEGLIRAAINKAFEVYSSIIKDSIRNNKDVFTDEEVKYSDSQKKIVREFMDMDLNLLSPKQALESVDALMNFLQNQSIAKMESVLAKYKGEVGMREIEDRGIKAKPIRKYWSKGLGRTLIEQTANIDIVFERMFGGFTKGGMVEDAMGVTALVNGKSKAQNESNNIVNKYVDKFYKLKPNGEVFNTAFNNIERGMVAFMSRNVVGTESEMNTEFNRRKNLIKESITELEKGNEQEVEKSKVYQEVYDKVLKDSNSIEQVQGKAAPENLEAVKFWQEEWLDKYDQLSETALGVYNKVLDKDVNYSMPDRYSKLSSDTSKIDITTEDMGFLVNSGTAPLYKKETGVLMASTRPDSLPKNPSTSKTSRYIDLSFDNNNANSMYDALVDINTAAPIRQVQSALNSDSFAKIMKGTGDEALLTNRIDLLVRNIRNKNPFSNDEFSKAVKSLNIISSIGVGQALGGVTAPVKQMVPMAANTLINAGGLDVQSIFDPAKQEFMDRSGYSIASRGVESQAQIETLNKMIENAAKSKPEQALKEIEKITNWWLKTFLVKSDVGIARASWMTYYEKSLKDQGINPETINYKTHEVNEKAANYAQRQVNRQQNISDVDLAGALLSDKNASKQLFVKMIMPFASFRMNQSARLGSDLSTIMDKTSTIEDKKIAWRSVGGFATEMAIFRAISAGIALLIASAVKKIMDRDDDEEKDKKKKDAIVKGQLTSTVADVFSPAPLLDKGIQVGASAILDATQDALDISEEDKLEIYSGNKQDFFQSLGLLGITGDRASQLYEMSTLAAGGSYTDNYGRKKYLSENDKDAIASLIPVALLSNIGLAPSEVNSIVRSSLAEAKRSGSTVEGAQSKSENTKIMGLNKEDLKRYYPDIYEQYYGEGTLDAEQRKLNKEKADIERKIKDEYYGYTPKKESKPESNKKSSDTKNNGGFGGKGFAD
jgi:hypothetical protein